MYKYCLWNLNKTTLWYSLTAGPTTTIWPETKNFIIQGAAKQPQPDFHSCASCETLSKGDNTIVWYLTKCRGKFYTILT